MQAAAIPSVSPRAAYAQRGTNNLQHVFRDHFASFAADYDARDAKVLGNFRMERISRVATRFLTNSVRLDGGDRTARQALAQYIARAPLPLQKLPDDRAGGRSCITPPVIPVSGRTRTRGAP